MRQARKFSFPICFRPFEVLQFSKMGIELPFGLEDFVLWVVEERKPLLGKPAGKFLIELEPNRSRGEKDYMSFGTDCRFGWIPIHLMDGDILGRATVFDDVEINNFVDNVI